MLSEASRPASGPENQGTHVAGTGWAWAQPAALLIHRCSAIVLTTVTEPCAGPPGWQRVPKGGVPWSPGRAPGSGFSHQKVTDHLWVLGFWPPRSLTATLSSRAEPQESQVLAPGGERGTGLHGVWGQRPSSSITRPGGRSTGVSCPEGTAPCSVCSAPLSACTRLRWRCQGAALGELGLPHRDCPAAWTAGQEAGLL